MSIRTVVKDLLTKREEKQYNRLLSAHRVTYDQWIRGKEAKLAETSGSLIRKKDWMGVAEGTLPVVCYEMTSPEVVILADGEGRVAEGAVTAIRQHLAEHPQTKLLYGDEDIWETPEKERSAPWFKPDWSPDTLSSYFYFGSLVAMRRELYEECVTDLEQKTRESGGTVAEDMDRVSRAQWYSIYENWVRFCAERAGGYVRSSESIGHIPQILFHGRNTESRKLYENCRSVEAQFGENAPHLLSIIIPSKDHPELVKQCLESLPAAAGQLPYEVILVDNGSSPENRTAVERLLAGVFPQGRSTYLYEPMEFNFSRMCNQGAAQAKGDLLLFLNDDVELSGAIETPLLEQMAARAGNAYTGAVGIKLYYPDSIRIQHAGITNLPMGPVHKLQFLKDNTCYQFFNRGDRNVIAVTAACLMVEKLKFREAGGFDEELTVAFNDVALCFSLWELGYYNVCCNDLWGYHHESVSRGDDEAPEKLARLLRERSLLYRKHPMLEGIDPYYAAGYAADGLDTRVRPAYETAGNRIQRVEDWKPWSPSGKYRQDACLLFRVESVLQDILHGYGAVLGDNNACYEFEILLKHGGNGEIYACKLQGQYRPDLQENMPDQQNVALAGIWIDLKREGLPTGNYQIGLAARNRVTGSGLMNWSNRENYEV